MRAGRLDRTIELLSPTAPVDDGYTLTSGGYAAAFTRKARYLPADPRETFETHGRVSSADAVFEVRSDTQTRTIGTTWQLTYGGKTYDIAGVQEDGRQETLRLFAVTNDRNI